jgi:hypothetical protein
VLKELNGKDAVVLFRLEFVVHDVAGYDAEVAVATESMCCFCVRELEKPVMELLGKISAR